MKKNTWNVRHLVVKSFVPLASQQTSVLYCRLFDLYICLASPLTLIPLGRNAFYQYDSKSWRTGLRATSREVPWTFSFEPHNTTFIASWNAHFGPFRYWMPPNNILQFSYFSINLYTFLSIPWSSNLPFLFPKMLKLKFYVICLQFLEMVLRSEVARRGLPFYNGVKIFIKSLLNLMSDISYLSFQDMNKICSKNAD